MTYRSLVALGATVLAGCSSPPAKKPETAGTAPPSLKITMFYVSPPSIGKGRSALVCYGVEGAAKIELEPPVEGVGPALSRCVEVRPKESVTYTLTALDSAGHSVTQKAALEVGPARPEGSRMIQAVTVDKHEVNPGEQVMICFIARGASSVTITPGPGAQPSAERGCAADKPLRTTTYEVIAKGGGQADTERVTVKVR